MPPIVNAAGGDTAYDVASDAQEKTLSATDSDPNNQTLEIDTGTKAIALGAKFTIADIYDVNQETKETTGSLKVFTVTGGDTGSATATSITISPAIIVSGPQKNCCGSATVSSTAADPSDGDTITFLGDATRNERSLLFQKGFCAFATADLYLPKGTDMASRQVHEGLSLRLVRDYTVKDDKLWTRIDILYGLRCFARSWASWSITTNLSGALRGPIYYDRIQTNQLAVFLPEKREHMGAPVV